MNKIRNYINKNLLIGLSKVEIENMIKTLTQNIDQNRINRNGDIMESVINDTELVAYATSDEITYINPKTFKFKNKAVDLFRYVNIKVNNKQNLSFKELKKIYRLTNKLHKLYWKK